MEDWLVFSLITLVAWGVWGFLGKLALSYYEWKAVYLISSIGCIFVYLAFLAWFKPSISLNWIFVLPLLVGIFGAGGAVFYFIALSKGKASIVVPLTALYPLLTVLLSFLILKEKVNFYQGMGIFFAIVAILLMSLTE
jgi:transporter family protein